MTVDVFAAYPSLTNDWQWLYGVESASRTNIAISISAGALGLEDLPASLFVSAHDRSKFLSNMGDFDGDGIPNCYELHYGTNPYVCDADLVPRVSVGAGGDFSSIGSALASSSEYAVIEIQTPESGDSIVDMPAHPVMLIGPTNGYAFIRSAASPYVFALNEGQDERTLFRNIYIEFLPSSSLQAGFWCGRNMPLGHGAGTPAASATFQNIYVRGNPQSSQCYGWMIRDWKDSPILLDRCVVNPAGANNFIGVCAMDTPDLTITNCTFVNFPPMDGDGYGVGIQVERIAATNGTVVSVAGCVFDESFTNAYPLARLGSGCTVSVENCILPRGFPANHGPDYSAGVAHASNVVSWTGHPVEGGVAEQLGLGALAALGEASTLDSDFDGLADWLEVYRYSTDPFKADHDGDRIVDGDEIAHGTDPRNQLEFCFDAHFSITNDASAATGAKASFMGAAHELTNDVTVLSAHVVVTNGVLPKLQLFLDLDDDGSFSTNEAFATLSYAVTGHCVSNSFALARHLADSDRDGIPDWWELQNGLSRTNSLDAASDDDGDGLINLHEYWAGCDPFTADGSNTVLSLFARSVDGRLPKPSRPCLYQNYTEAGVLQGLAMNTNSWACDIDLSCASPWNGWRSEREAGVLISRRHALFAKHYLFSKGSGDNKLYFRTRDGGCYQASIAATNASERIDFVVTILESDATDSISVAKILPSNYAMYIADGRGLPMLTLDFEEKALIHEISSLGPNSDNLSAKFPSNEDRLAQSEQFVKGDSGNPRFLVAGSEPILVSTLSSGDGTAAMGPFVTACRAEIQGLMDELTINAGLSTNDYQLLEYDLSGYQQLQYGVPQ